MTATGRLFCARPRQDRARCRRHAHAVVGGDPRRLPRQARGRAPRRDADLLDTRRHSTAKGGRPWPPRPYTSDRLGIDFRHIRAWCSARDDQRQIQDMRRSGAVEAMRGDADADEAVGQDGEHASRHRTGCTGPICRSTSPRCATWMRPAAAVENESRSKKLQLRTGQKLQPK